MRYYPERHMRIRGIMRMADSRPLMRPAALLLFLLTALLPPLCGAAAAFSVFLERRDTPGRAVALARRFPLLRLPLLLFLCAGYLLFALFDGLRAGAGALFRYARYAVRRPRAVCRERGAGEPGSK